MMGPIPDIARQFPHTRQARLCVTIWVLRRAAPAFRLALRALLAVRHFAVAVEHRTGCGRRLRAARTHLALGLWAMRPDLQARCDLRSHEGRSALLEWFLAEGMKEFEFDDVWMVGGLFRRRFRLAPPKPSALVSTKPAVKRDFVPGRICRPGLWPGRRSAHDRPSRCAGKTGDARSLDRLFRRNHHRGWLRRRRICRAAPD